MKTLQDSKGLIGELKEVDGEEEEEEEVEVPPKPTKLPMKAPEHNTSASILLQQRRKTMLECT